METVQVASYNPSTNLLTASKRKPKKLVKDSMNFYKLVGNFNVMFD